jgi:hypothetical protein
LGRQLRGIVAQIGQFIQKCCGDLFAECGDRLGVDGGNPAAGQADNDE